MPLKTVIVLPLVLLLAACAVPITSHGSSRYPDYGSHRVGYLAYDNGYRDGLREGRDDSRDRDRYNPRNSREYRSADNGYNRRLGSRSAYRDRYRRGFVDGYRGGLSQLQGARTGTEAVGAPPGLDGLEA